MKAKEEAVFARVEAESSKEKVEEEAYDLGVVETQATLKAQVPRVYRLYCSQVWNEAFKQARVETSSNLWKVENVYYPPAIRETAPSSSEAKDALEDVETAGPKAALAITAPDEPVRKSELSRATETNEGSNLEAPQKTVESVADDQAHHTEKSSLLVQPLQTVPPSEALWILRPFLLSSPRKEST